MQITYCEWYDKKLADVFEHEQEECSGNGNYCGDCQSLTSKECDEEEL